MKSKKIVAGILAAAITVSSIAPEAFAHIIGTDSNGNYCVNVSDLMDNDTDISDVYGATVKFTDESAEVLSRGAGGGFVFNTSRGWDQLQWCTGCGEKETHDIFWNTETNSITRLDTSPICTEDDIVMRSAEIALSQWWGDNISIKSISLLDKDGNELTSKDMPDNPAPGDSSGGIEEPDEPTPGESSGGIEEPDEPCPGESSGDVPEPGEDETDYIETVCSSVEQLQTPHPYKNNSYYSYTYTDESCSNLKVTFSEDSYTEQGCDTVTIYDETGEECTTLSGDELSGAIVLIPGNTVKIVLTTDGSITNYGFRVESVENVDKVPKQGDPEYDFVIEPTQDYFGNNTYSLVSYRGAGGDIVVPSEINGNKITIIDGPAFYENENITSVTLPDSIEEFGSGAFAYCTALTKINIPASLKIIGYDVFDNCNQLEEIVVDISENTGYSIVSARDDSISSFGSMPSLKKFTANYIDGYDEDASYRVSVIDGVYIYYNSIFCYPEMKMDKTYIMPSDCSADSGAFYHAKFEELYIGDGGIGANNLYECENLKRIYVSEENQKYTDVDGVLFSKDKTELIAYPPARTDVDYKIPDEVNKINKDAFRNTLLLKRQDKNYIKYADNWVIGYEKEDYSDTDYNTCIVNNKLYLKYGTVGIACEALNGINSIDEVVFPATIRYINDSAFTCSSIGKITIPGSINTIEGSTFEYCKQLSEVTLENGIETIGAEAFRGCDAISSITIPGSVKKIDYAAFYACSNLAEVKLNEGLTEIRENAFYDNSSLSDIKIPDSVEYLSGDAFQNTHITESQADNGYVYVDNWLVEIHSDKINGNKADIRYGTIGIATDAFAWESDISEITVPDTVKHICNNAFRGCENLTSIAIPDGVTSIHDGTFSYCEKLTSITIPGSVTYIGDDAFRKCTSLKTVTIPTSVTYIGSNAFNRCTSFESFTIPTSVTYIGNEAFLDCTSLKSITIPTSVTYIGNEAFLDCTSLKSITIPASVTYIGDYALGYYTIAHSGGGPGYAWVSYENKKLDEFKINCYSGTAGEQYAKENDFEYELLSCTNHKFGNWNITEEATCTATGTQTGTCSVCGKTETQAIPALGHDYSTDWTTDKSATCGAVGSKSHHCTRCGAKKDVTAILATGKHDFNNWKTTKAATYTATGTKTRTCKVCKKTETATIAKLTLAKIGGFKVKAKDSTSITLQWSRNANASGYIIEAYNGKTWVQVTKIAKNSTLTYKVTKLSASKTYQYRIKAYKTEGKATAYSANSATLGVNTNPSNMSGFKAKAKSYNSITLQWNKNTSATGYELQKWDGKKWVTLTKISKNSTITYTVKSLKASTTYKYRIRAYKTIGKTTQYSAYTTTLSVNTNPSNMSGFKVKAKSYNSITLQWNKNTSATGYELQKWDGKKWTTLTKISKNSTTTYTIRGLKASTTYKYRIKAYKTIGKATQYSAYSATLSVNTNPSNMNGFKAKSKSYNSITLQWNKNTSATGYELQKWDGKKWVTLTKISKNSTTTYTVKSLKASTTYKYRIRAYKTIGKATQYSAYTATLSVNTNPSNMSGFKVKSKSYNSITLQWNKNTSATGYELQKWDGKKWVTLTKISKNSTTTYTVKSLKASTTYKYRIRAYKTIGKTTQYSAYTATLSVNTNPSNMNGFKAKSTAKTSVTLQWNKNTSATGYEIQKWNGKKWISAAKVTKNSTVTSTVKSLKANTSYKFRIRAYKTIGKATQYSSWSGTLTIKTKK